MLLYLQMIESEKEQSEFKEIYEKYKGLMFYVANNILHNEHDAEDAVHQSFVYVLENLKKFYKFDCREMRYNLVTLVRWRAIDLLRRKSGEEAIEYRDELTGTEIPLPGDHGLADAMAKLPPQYREVLVLRYDSGYRVAEIAKMKGKSHCAIEKTLERAKQRLRTLLKEDGVEI